MAIYTVHLPPEDKGPMRAEDVRFIKDGFSFAALFLPLLWLLWHRLWLALLGFLAVALAIDSIGRFWSEMAAVVVGVGFAFWFALEARDILRWTLRRRGYRLVAVVEGHDRDSAERRYFETSMLEVDSAPQPAPPHGGPSRYITPTGQARPAGPVTGPVIGLFPTPGGR
jgi:hypothetical protein